LENDREQALPTGQVVGLNGRKLLKVHATNQLVMH
jgi:hypothetical protein